MEIEAILSVLRLQLRQLNDAIRLLEGMYLTGARFSDSVTGLKSDKQTARRSRRSNGEANPAHGPLDLISVQLEEA
jgi:hypothetical protein